jgi:hypothetical protein
MPRQGAPNQALILSSGADTESSPHSVVGSSIGGSGTTNAPKSFTRESRDPKHHFRRLLVIVIDANAKCSEAKKVIYKNQWDQWFERVAAIPAEDSKINSVFPTLLRKVSHHPDKMDKYLEKMDKYLQQFTLALPTGAGTGRTSSTSRPVECILQPQDPPPGEMSHKENPPMNETLSAARMALAAARARVADAHAPTCEDRNLAALVHRACTLPREEAGSHLSMIERLLEQRADPNEGDDLGETPLMEAVRYGRGDLSRILIGRGARNCVSDDCLV